LRLVNVFDCVKFLKLEYDMKALKLINPEYVLKLKCTNLGNILYHVKFM